MFLTERELSRHRDNGVLEDLMKGTRLIDIRVGDWCWSRYEWVEYLLSEMRTGIFKLTGGVEPTDRWLLET